MYQSIQQYCDALSSGYEAIPAARRTLLEQLAAYISRKLTTGEPVQLVYICTHNSRRSHFGQIWARVAGSYYGFTAINTYSGGTETTAFHPNAIAALERAGFKVIVKSGGDNPHYLVHYDAQQPPIEAFSKAYDDAANPKDRFAAVMTCGEAEQNCPFIPGVELRLGSSYEDPKAFDLTPEQDRAYDERCRQIAQECLYVFSKVKQGTA